MIQLKISTDAIVTNSEIIKKYRSVREKAELRGKVFILKNNRPDAVLYSIAAYKRFSVLIEHVEELNNADYVKFMDNVPHEDSAPSTPSSSLGKDETPMKKANPKRFFSLLLALFVATSLIIPAYAASPAKIILGSTSNFAILAASAITNTGTTTISGDAGGDIGLFPGSAYGSVGITTTGTAYISDAGGVAAAAQNDLTTAYNQAAGTASTATISADLGGMTLVPGVYTSGTSLSLTGVLTLDGQNDPESVFIFQAGSTLTTASVSEVRLINGARFCRVFWQVGSSATLGTNSIFRGHILAQASITATTGVYVQGQLLARTGAVTLDSNVILNGLCADAATLTVIKQVINDDTGIALPADFTLSVKTPGLAGTHVTGSPQIGSTLGSVYKLLPGNYVISETAHAGYSSTFLGADINGNVTLSAGENRVVTLINNDIAPVVIAPLINVVKTPSPLSLPYGSGIVTYTYTVTNPGVVNLSSVTVTDNKVNNINYISGDTNLDMLLQPSETWIYRGSAILYTTTTNRATATGSGNGLLATDTAFATVVVTPVAQPPVYPPLVNIVKTASPLALLYGEGPVTYTYRVTNPGLVTLSNIIVTDDKINVITYVSGDINLDNLMQTSETWIYTATDVLTETTVNTATVTGRANGMLSTDTSIATVIFTPAIVVPVVQPLINVVKVPSVSSLTGSAAVTYTYRVTNPGTVVLNHVTLLDDKIDLVVYQSGDLNNDSLLQPGEAWIYEAEAVLFETTTNRATARGIGNNIVVYNTDDATITVTPAVVQPPTDEGGVLPVTASPWYNLLLAGCMMIVLGLTGWIFLKVYE